MSIVVLLRFRLAYSIMFTEPSRLICIRVFDFYYYNLIHSRLYVLEYLLYITGGVDLVGRRSYRPSIAPYQ
jgi:hypothetical protein